MQLQSGVSLGERKLGELHRAGARAIFCAPKFIRGMRLCRPRRKLAARIVVCRQAGDIMRAAKWQESDNERTAELCFQFILTYVRAYLADADATLGGF